MTSPHDSWASVYDIAYEQSFGEFYNELTKITLDTISNSIDPPARIVDFGAGTGRLSIPLASMGYEVLAVDPSKEMIDQLKRKDGALRVRTFNGRMQNYQSDTLFDMAICVFTVLIYLLDEESLERSIEAVSSALRPKGLLLIDIPSRKIFQSYESFTPKVQRSVSVVESQDEDIYEYSESVTVEINSKSNTYTDQFAIKYWEVDDVLEILSKNAFMVEKDMSDKFAGAGSDYFLMRKEE